MSEPLFTNDCIPNPPPKVDFKFIDFCDIPPPPPPIYECPAPPCPPHDTPPDCPEITPGTTTVTVTTTRGDCTPSKPTGGSLTVKKKSEDCVFEIDLDLDIDVPVPPCPNIRGGRVNVTSGYAGCIPGEGGTVTVTPKPPPCADPNAPCEFDIDIDIVVPIPKPPCPTIRGGAITVTSGYGECGQPNGGKISVVPTQNSSCAGDDCDFQIDIEIDVPLPTPPCPRLNTSYRTVRNGERPSLSGRVDPNPLCDDGSNCDIFIEVVFPEPPCVPVFTPGSITVRQSDNPSSNNQFLIERVQNPNKPEECTYRPFGYIQIPKIPQMPEIPSWVKNTPKAPCIPTITGGEITGNKVKGRITVAAPPPPPEEPEEPEEPRAECLGSCRILNQEPFNINTADAYGPVQDTLWDTCYPMGTFAVVTDERSCVQFGGTYFSGNDCTDCPPAPPSPAPTPTQSKPCSELQISAELELELPEAPCTPRFTKGKVNVSYQKEAGGEITVKDSTSCNSCYYAENSVGAILAMQVSNGTQGWVPGISVAPAVCVPADDLGSADNSTMCEQRGGTCFPSGDCSTSCKDLEISAYVYVPPNCPEFEDGTITKKAAAEERQHLATARQK